MRASLRYVAANVLTDKVNFVFLTLKMSNKNARKNDRNFVFSLFFFSRFFWIKFLKNIALNKKYLGLGEAIC